MESHAINKEHSDENLEFWDAVMSYRDTASTVYTNISKLPSTRRLTAMFQEGLISSAASVRSLDDNQSMISLGSQGSLANNGGEVDEVKKATLKDELDGIIAKYLTEGSMKEINIPGKVRAKLVKEIDEKRNYHPDIFRSVLEHTYITMKLSSLPNFIKYSIPKITA
ncbi:hypothetical protein HDV05_000264 [Chytridiales sp. JEL 0842]|nr:hypothetical protein HDV05_000264 [Chytridiales sp. JEL 0842]